MGRERASRCGWWTRRARWVGARRCPDGVRDGGARGLRECPPGPARTAAGPERRAVPGPAGGALSEGLPEHHPAARHAVEQPCWNLLSQQQGRPLCQLLSPEARTEVLVNALLGASSPEGLADESRRAVTEGYGTLEAEGRRPAPGRGRGAAPRRPRGDGSPGPAAPRRQRGLDGSRGRALPGHPGPSPARAVRAARGPTRRSRPWTAWGHTLPAPWPWMNP